jgi:NitT/TauT family transport system permease protein
MKTRWLANLGWPLAVLAVVLVLWHVGTRLFEVPAYIVPGPLQVLSSGWEKRSNLMQSVQISAVEAGGGFLCSIVGGVGLAFVLAQSAIIRRCMFPYTILLQTVPILAIAPLILMWFGSGLRSVILIVFIICLFPIVANTTQGLISVDPNLLNLFRMSNASRGQLLLKLRFPHAVPNFFVGLRISSGLSVIGAFTGEWFASSNAVGQGGLGYAIIYANSQLQTDYLFALVLACAALGSSFFLVVVGFEWLLLHQWHASAMPSDNE